MNAQETVPTVIARRAQRLSAQAIARPSTLTPQLFPEASRPSENAKCAGFVRFCSNLLRSPLPTPTSLTLSLPGNLETHGACKSLVQSTMKPHPPSAAGSPSPPSQLAAPAVCAPDELESETGHCPDAVRICPVLSGFVRIATRQGAETRIIRGHRRRTNRSGFESKRTGGKGTEWMSSQRGCGTRPTPAAIGDSRCAHKTGAKGGQFRPKLASQG